MRIVKKIILLTGLIASQYTIDTFTMKSLIDGAIVLGNGIQEHKGKIALGGAALLGCSFLLHKINENYKKNIIETGEVLTMTAGACALGASLQAALTQFENSKFFQDNQIKISVGVCLSCLALGTVAAFRYFRDPKTVCSAAATGNLLSLKTSLWLGASPDAEGYYPLCDYKQSALKHAIDRGQHQAAKLLLEHKANIANQPLLHKAIYNKDIESVKILLDYGADIEGISPLSNTTPLIEAIREGHNDIVRLLIARNARVTPVSFRYVSEEERQETFNILLDHIKADEKMLNEVLLDHGVVLLYHGVEDNSLYFQMLIDAGADINARSQDKRPLIYQAIIARENIDLAQKLLAMGANINPPGENLLLNGVCQDIHDRRRFKVTKFLLEAGVDLNARGWNDETALIYLTRFADDSGLRFKLIKLLMYLGADHTLKSNPHSGSRDEERKTALEYLAEAFDYHKKGADRTTRDYDQCIKILQDPSNISTYLTDDEKKEFEEIKQKRIQAIKAAYEHNAKAIQQVSPNNELTAPQTTSTGQSVNNPLQVITEYLGTELIK